MRIGKRRRDRWKSLEATPLVARQGHVGRHMCNIRGGNRRRRAGYNTDAETQDATNGSLAVKATSGPDDS